MLLLFCLLGVQNLNIYSYVYIFKMGSSHVLKFITNALIYMVVPFK